MSIKSKFMVKRLKIILYQFIRILIILFNFKSNFNAKFKTNIEFNIPI
jgi:hypothetical protein